MFFHHKKEKLAETGSLFMFERYCSMMLTGANRKAGRPVFLKRVASTMKGEGTETRFELLFTRTPGYLWALLFRHFGVHPTIVTVVSILLGCAAGCFFGQTSVGYNVTGVCLLVWANWYDCADGQLARMTGKTSLTGRILDGFAGDLWFFSIYFFICLRLQAEWGVVVWLLATWAGLHCHVKQCALADYYRNVHLYLLSDGRRGEWDNSRALKERRSVLVGKDAWFEKLHLFFYIRYTLQQERSTPSLQRLRRKLDKEYGSLLPKDVRPLFEERSRALMPACNLLTFDLRAGVLCLTCVMGVPWAYFLFECTFLEWLRLFTRRRHEALSRSLFEKLSFHA